MLPFKMKKNIKGYTLLELMLVLGVITLLVIAIYTAYAKKATSEAVKNQTAYLSSLTNSINEAFIASKVDVTSTATEGYSKLTNTSAISANLVPTSLVNGASTIKNIFGGNITLSSTTITNVTGTLPAYSISLTNIPSAACTLLTTTDYANSMQEVWVGTVRVKTAGTSQTNISTATTACAAATSSTVEFRNFKLVDNMLSGAVVTRTKENPYYIASIGDVITSGATACAGGSAWNGSFCACPINTQWNGTSCVAFGSTAGWCNKGQSWNGTACITTPTTAATFSHYTANFNAMTSTSAPTVTSAVASPIAIYMNASGFNPALGPNTQTTSGRYLPDLPTSIVASNTADTILKKSAGSSCAAGGNFDGRICQVCVNGTWDTTLLRCVTPVNPTPPPGFTPSTFP